jgi:hypothetical protein
VNGGHIIEKQLLMGWLDEVEPLAAGDLQPYVGGVVHDDALERHGPSAAVHFDFEKAMKILGVACGT